MKNLRIYLAAMMVLACAACGSEPTKPSVAPPAQAAQNSGTNLLMQACKLPGFECLYQPITVNIAHRDGSPYSMVLQSPNVVIQHNSVTVFAGQTVNIEGDIQGDKLVNLHMVDSVTHPEKTIVMQLEQVAMDNIPGGHMMIFTINNPFDLNMKYHAEMMPLDMPPGRKQGFFKTSTCPVMAKISGSESWPEPIFQLMLSDFHFPDPASAEGSTCSE